MKKISLLYLSIGLGFVVSMASCDSNKSQLDKASIVDDSTQYVETSVAPAVDSTQNVQTSGIQAADSTIPAPAVNEVSLSEDTIKKTSNNRELNIKITPGKMKNKYNEFAEGWKASMTISVTNLSDSPVSASDYTITYKCKESNGYTDDSERTYTTNLTHKGVNLGPKETKKITISRGEAYKFYDFKVKSKKK